MFWHFWVSNSFFKSLGIFFNCLVTLFLSPILFRFLPIPEHRYWVCKTSENVEAWIWQAHRCKKWACGTLSLIFFSKKVIWPNLAKFYTCKCIFGCLCSTAERGHSLGRRVGYMCWQVWVHLAKQWELYSEPPGQKSQPIELEKNEFSEFSSTRKYNQLLLEKQIQQKYEIRQTFVLLYQLYWLQFGKMIRWQNDSALYNCFNSFKFWNKILSTFKIATFN